ncbi:MAG: o-succinylbenzoate synthase [Bifidobacteriaceae bacterium]|nr:o-succinylbenzoate synthase [Bifidobacteriaceae bacterium]
MDGPRIAENLFAHAFSVPLVTEFRGITVREGVILAGPAGFGEFSPFWDYNPDDAVPWLRAAVEAATSGFPPALRTEIPVNATVPAVGPDAGAAIVRESGGCRTVKVKVAGPGDTLDAERDRVAAVRDAVGPRGAIRIDANGAWDVDTAVDRLAALDKAAGGLEYAEQPCRSIADLAAVRRRTRVPIAADESIRHSADPLAVVRHRAADVAVLKVQPLGGVRACLELAERLDLPVVVSSALETAVGIAAGLALAAALPVAPLACGLATGQLLGADVTSTPPRPRHGVMRVDNPVPDRLDTLAADAGRRAAWSRRLREVMGLLDADPESPASRGSGIAQRPRAGGDALAEHGGAGGPA